MKAYCRFSSCAWFGQVTELYKHCLMEHAKFVKEINDDNFCDLKLNQMQDDTFLLSGKEGLYWFIADRRQQDTSGIRRGIFAIDDSEINEYVILVGTNFDQFIASQGPYITNPLKSKQFEIFWNFRQLVMYHQVQAICVRIIFFDPKAPKDFNWENFEDTTYLKSDLTCMTCVKPVHASDHYCINYHRLCRRCLSILQPFIGVATNVCPFCPKQCFSQNNDPPYYSDEED